MPLNGCVTLSELLSLSVLLFPHVSNGGSDRTRLMRIKWALSRSAYLDSRTFFSRNLISFLPFSVIQDLVPGLFFHPTSELPRGAKGVCPPAPELPDLQSLGSFLQIASQGSLWCANLCSEVLPPTPALMLSSVLTELCEVGITVFILQTKKPSVRACTGSGGFSQGSAERAPTRPVSPHPV